MADAVRLPRRSFKGKRFQISDTTLFNVEAPTGEVGSGPPCTAAAAAAAASGAQQAGQGRGTAVTCLARPAGLAGGVACLSLPRRCACWPVGAHAAAAVATFGAIAGGGAGCDHPVVGV